MAVCGKEVTQLRHMRVHLETLIPRALGAAVRNLAELHCQKFRPPRAHKAESTICRNSDQFCLAL